MTPLAQLRRSTLALPEATSRVTDTGVVTFTVRESRAQTP